MGVKIRFPITKKNLPRKKSALMGFSPHKKNVLLIIMVSTGQGQQ